MDTTRFSALSGEVTEISGASQVPETQPQPTVIGFQNTTPDDFANDINMADSTAGSTRPTTPTNVHKQPRPAEIPSVTSSQTGPQIPLCLLPTNTQPFHTGNICTGGEIFDNPNELDNMGCRSWQCRFVRNVST
jgi:hypothetical protein